MTHQDLFPAVVIGGGLAGLTAALHLAARDVPPLVLEADAEWPGGCLAGGAPDTFEHNGRIWSFNSEHGAHALWGGYDNMRAVLDRFVGVELRESEGEEWINRWGREVCAVEAGTAIRKTWIPAPFHYLQLLLRPRFWGTITLLDFLSLPGFLYSIIFTVGFDPIMEQRPLDGMILEDYFPFWTPNLRATFAGLAHSLLAAPSESISLTAFIAALRFYTMLRRDSWRMAYLPGNPHDCLIQPMIDKIEARDGMVMLGARAVSLERLDGADGWLVRVEDAQRGGVRTLRARRVILAVEPPAAEQILLAGADTAELAERIKFPHALPCAAVRLWFDAQPRAGAPGGMFTGDFPMDNFFWLHRLYKEFFEWGEAGGSAIEMHFYAAEDVLDRSDEVLIITAASEVMHAFPALRGHFVSGAVRRNGRHQTRFRVPDAASLRVETPWPGVLACGDWIGYSSPAFWMERCCITGIAAANHVLAANGAEPFPILPPRRPEWLARGIGGVVHAARRVLGPPIYGAARLLRGR
ncbi:MAG: FAD-dependent oxidoreductase [Anaerolineae bacterium]|nr:FAD-dependent oxidoreductase [Anaerolineae bacterium]